MSWLAENWGSLLVGAVLLAVVAAILVHLVRKKKSGDGGCGCGCAGCPGRGLCHPEKSN